MPSVLRPYVSKKTFFAVEVTDMNMQYFVSPFKLAVAACTSIFSFIIAGVQIYLGEGLAAILFLTIAILFLAVAAINGSVVAFSPSGVQKKLVFFTLSSLSWPDIKEVGVVGTRVFNGHHSERTGTRYIYFSTSSLSEEERFSLALKWPPKKMIYLQYSKARLETIQFLWEKRIDTYNAGDVFFR